MVTIAHSFADDSAEGPDVFELALRALLPSHHDGLLLQACLADGVAAERAWSGFVATVGNPRTFFAMDRAGLKELLPVLAASLARNEIDVDAQFQAYLQQAGAAEALRAREYTDSLGEVLRVFEERAISPLLLKGGAVSAAVYPRPSRRHNHAIDLLVEPHHLKESVSLLTRIGWIPRARSPSAVTGEGAHRDMWHANGFVMGLHSTPFFLPHFRLKTGDLDARARVIAIREHPAWILSPEDMLVHLCGHATYSRSRFNLRWACDVFFLLQRHPRIDWRLVLDTATAAGLALPLAVQLQWLREVLAAPVPAACIAELEIRGRPLDPVAREGVFASLLHATLSRPRCLSALSGDGAAMLGFLRFSVAPSVRYVRWRHNISRSWQIPGWYLDRPRRGALRLLRTGVRRFQRVTARIG